MNYREADVKLTKLLKLYENPVGIKFAQSEDDFKGISKIKKKCYSCQLMKIAATGGFICGADEKALNCPNERVAFGMATEKDIKLGTEAQTKKYAAGNKELGQKMIDNRPKKKMYGFIAGPLGKIKFDPDIIYIPCIAWQVQRLVHAWVCQTGEDVECRFGTNATVCAYGSIQAYNTDKPTIFLFCSGGREQAKGSDYELGFCFPTKYLDTIIEGLERTDKTGLRVPHFIYYGIPVANPKSIFKED